MQTKYIGILICLSLNQPKCPLINKEDVAYLVEKGYLEDNFNLTKKATDLLETIQITSDVFENSHCVKQEASDTIHGMKKVMGDMFTAFRTNTSDMLQKMSDNIKVK